MSLGRFVTRGAGRQVKFVRPVPPAAAGPLQLRVYQQVEQEMLVVVPPFLLHSPAPETLAGYWMLFRETTLAAGTSGRAAREAVASAVSVANTCPYCVDMHSMSLYELVGPDQAEAVACDRPEHLTDPYLRNLTGWARAAHLAGRQPPPGRDEAAVAELVGLVVAFHYLNRMVNVFLTRPLLPARLRGAARRRVKQGAARLLKPMLHGEFAPGASVDLLPERPLPPDAGWAAASPPVAAAVARASAAFEAAGVTSLPERVRELVDARLDEWRGEPAGPGRSWLAGAVAPLPAQERPAGRFALLTALASDLVDESTVEDFRAGGLDDRALVGAAAWASYAAARRVGARLPATGSRPGQAHPAG